MGERNRGRTHLWNGGLNLECLAIVRRRTILYLCMHHDEHSSGLHQSCDRESAIFEILRPRPLEVFEVVGVIDHPSAIRILIINSDFHARSPVYSGSGLWNRFSEDWLRQVGCQLATNLGMSR